MTRNKQTVALLLASVCISRGCTAGSALPHDGDATPDAASEVAEGGGFGTFDGSVALGEQSPGQATLEFLVDPARPFCDQTSSCEPGPVHIMLLTADGQPIGALPPATCSATPPPCEQVCRGPQNSCITSICASGAVAFAGQVMNWDGAYQEQVACGTTTCVRSRFVPAGHYLARMCASPGTLSPSDGIQPASCTPAGSTECVTVPFDIPAPDVVVGQLPAN